MRTFYDRMVGKYRDRMDRVGIEGLDHLASATYQPFSTHTDLQRDPKVAADLMREFSMYRNLLYFEHWGRQVLSLGPGLWEKFSSTPLPDVFEQHTNLTLNITLPHFYEVHMPYPALYIHFDGHTPFIGSREADGMFVFESCIDDPTLIINPDGPMLKENIDSFVMVLGSKETWAIQTIPKQPTDFIHSMFIHRQSRELRIDAELFDALHNIFGAKPRWSPERQADSRTRFVNLPISPTSHA